MSEKIQLITFQMSRRNCGVNIMDVDSIIDVQEYRELPNSPSYVKGILTIRKEFIPLINLQDKLHLEKVELTNEEKLLSCYMILQLAKTKVAVMIDKILRVSMVDEDKIQKSPNLITDIGTEYIKGIVVDENDKDGYLVILDFNKIFKTSLDLVYYS